MQNEMFESPGEETNSLPLDPANSERRIYRDQITGLQREIWRPGSKISTREWRELALLIQC